jgi:hypothetical protein
MGVNWPISRSLVWALDWSHFVPVLLLIAALVVGALVIALMQRWRRHNPSLSPSPSEQMAQYRSLYEQGILSEEEYRRLRATLTGDLRRAVDLPAPPGPVGPSTEPAPPSNNDQPPASGTQPA